MVSVVYAVIGYDGENTWVRGDRVFVHEEDAEASAGPLDYVEEFEVLDGPVV